MHTAVGITDVAQRVPDAFVLEQNYPNPFNPSTHIPYAVKTKSLVTLNVYDVSGKKVRTLVNETKNPGNYEVVFQAGNLAGGVYIVQMRSGSFSDFKKIIFIK
jgi:hypothetical protein